MMTQHSPALADRLSMSKVANFPWQFVPWMTILLATMLWVIHILVHWVEDPAAFWDSYGIRHGDYHTYITYGFLHADLAHILQNTIGLLVFGTVVELQARRFWYISIVAISIFAGALCVVHFPYPAPPDLPERVVGFSAAGWALNVMAIGVLIRHWGWGKGLFWVSVVLFGALGVDELNSMGSGEITPVTGVLVTALFGLGIWLTLHYRSHHRPALCGLIPILWMILPLSRLLNAHGVHPGEVGHLAGALTGAILLYPILRNKVVTDRTAKAIGVVNRLWYASGRVVRDNWERRILPGVLCLLVGVTIFIYIQDQWG